MILFPSFTYSRSVIHSLLTNDLTPPPMDNEYYGSERFRDHPLYFLRSGLDKSHVNSNADDTLYYDSSNYDYSDPIDYNYSDDELLKKLSADKKFYVYYLNDSQKVVQEIDGINFTVYLDFDDSEDISFPDNGPFVHNISLFGDAVSMNNDNHTLDDLVEEKYIRKAVDIFTQRSTSIQNVPSFVATQEHVKRGFYEPTDKHKPIHKRCLEVVDIGNCGKDLDMWYFNFNTLECTKFAYKGCGKSLNIFASYDSCEEYCLPTKSIHYMW
ncbi:unnamed protein product [Gordionus sp. m RMFG-2023]